MIRPLLARFATPLLVHFNPLPRIGTDEPPANASSLGFTGDVSNAL